MALTFKACSVDGCKGNAAKAASGARGWCNAHYLRWNRLGDPQAGGKMYDMHGMRKNRIYDLWFAMLRRCGHRKFSNPRSDRYYKDRGVRVCAAWQEFAIFAEWANANGYADDLTIDRIDSDFGYDPANCRWVTQTDNIRAQKQVKLTMEDAREIRRLRGAGMRRAEVAKKFGIHFSHVRNITSGKSWVE